MNKRRCGAYEASAQYLIFFAVVCAIGTVISLDIVFRRSYIPPEFVDINKNETTLFLFMEVNGVDITDFQGFPRNIAQHFHKVAVISPNYSPASSSNVDQEIALWDEIEVMIKEIDSSLTVERWLGIYFGRDATCPLNMCNAQSTLWCPVNKIGTQEECTNALQAYMVKYSGLNVTGVIFDDEVGDSTKIVRAMETLAPTYKLGWSAGLNALKYNSPRNIPSNYSWDVMLAQAYTAGSVASFYRIEGCDISMNFWTNVHKFSVPIPQATEEETAFWLYKMVPMFCGAGTCQEPRKINQPGLCVDERLSYSTLERILDEKPEFIHFRNFGIWYGTVKATSWRSGPYRCYLENSTNWETQCVVCTENTPCIEYK